MNIRLAQLAPEQQLQHPSRLFRGELKPQIRRELFQRDEPPGALRFDFDDDGKVEFIEFLGSIDGELQPIIYDVPAFQSKADTLYNILREENRGDIDDSEDGYSYGFLNISVGVYRSSIPKDVEEMIKEADEAGEPMDAGDIEEERRKADYWSTIGIGIEDYYR